MAKPRIHPTFERITASFDALGHFIPPYDYSVFRDDLGRFLTTSLFIEKAYRSDEKFKPYFTLSNRDKEVEGVTYFSLKKIYFAYEHVPGFEYDFAMDVFGYWEHWVKLTEESSLRKMFQEWRDEYEIKLKAQAMRSLIAVSRVADPKGVAAAKYLAEKGYVSRKGRPSKEEIERQRKIDASVRDNLDEDMQRLGLSIVNGAK